MCQLADGETLELVGTDRFDSETDSFLAPAECRRRTVQSEGEVAMKSVSWRSPARRAVVG